MFDFVSVELLIWIGAVTGCASFVMCIGIIIWLIRNGDRETPSDSESERWHWLDR